MATCGRKLLDEASATNPQRPITLTPGQSVTVVIEAKRHKNRTSVFFDSGAVYDLSATGKWSDGVREIGPEGYSGESFLKHFLDWLRPSPDCNWLALLGVAETRKPAFYIGTQATYEARQAGELICFANVVRGFYWKNSNAVELTITRIL